MKELRWIWIVCLVWICQHSFALPNTEGTTFWLTYMNNFRSEANDEALHLKIIISSVSANHITLSNPQTGWKDEEYIEGGQMTEIEIPHNQAYTVQAGKIEPHGIVVQSRSPISLYAANYRSYSYDATLVLPYDALGTEYIIQVYEDDKMSKEMAVVATADHTDVRITPHALTTSGQEREQSFVVRLQKGESYQVMSDEMEHDFSGTRVQANHPIAVFSGNQCANIPQNTYACDHIVEQQLPINQWGKRFVITRSANSGNRVRISAKDDATSVRINGEEVCRLDARETYEFRLESPSAYIECSAPAACYLYIEGAQNNYIGDPSSVYIAPIEQGVKEVVFSTFQTEVSRVHYVNIVTSKAGVYSVELDGKFIADQFKPVEGNDAYCYAQIMLAHGNHRISSKKEFVGYVYGVGWCESYAYSIGSSTIPLDGEILVDEEPRADLAYYDWRCYKKPIHFAPRSSQAFESILWDFGDGHTSTAREVSHTYMAPGSYRVRMILTSGAMADTAYTTLWLDDEVRDTIYAELCENERFEVEGEVFTQTGRYEIIVPSEGGCDSIITLYLTSYKKYHVAIKDSFHMGTSYRWNGEWYNQAGVYVDTLLSKNGCDSIVELTLIASDTAKIMYDTICWQPSYQYKGKAYPLPDYSGYEDEEYMDVVLLYHDKKGCETYKMYLAIVPQRDGQTEVIYDTIMAGEIYDFYGRTLTESGTYRHKENSACGCTTHHILHLWVKYFEPTLIQGELCQSDTFAFRERVYTEVGVYYDTVFGQAGIDTIYAISLIDARDSIDIAIEICEGDQYIVGKKAYRQAGSYIDTLANRAGCDSIIKLELSILPHTYSEETRIITDGEEYKWQGKTFTQSGDYTHTMPNMYGCDSILTLHLLPNEVVVRSVYATELCTEENILEITMDVAGIVDSVGVYLATDTTNSICDTLLPMPADGYIDLVLDNLRAGHYQVQVTGYTYQCRVFTHLVPLQVLYPSSVLEQRWNDVICVLTGAYNGGYHFTEFQWYKDGLPITGATNYYLSTPLEIGAEYSAMLTDSTGMQLMTCPIIAVDRSDIKLYPTVVQRQQSIRCEVQANAEVYVYTIDGNLLIHKRLTRGENDIDLSIAAGIYIVRIQTEMNTEKITKVVVI